VTRTVISFLLLCGLFAGVMPVQAENVVVTQAWVRALLPTRTMTAAFLTIENHSEREEKLVGVASGRVKTIEIHGHSHVGGMMRMRQVQSLAVAAGETQALEPGGFHLMLFDVDASLVEGDSLPLILEFESGLQLSIDANVKSVLQE